MMKWSFPAGTIAGIPIRIHWTLLILWGIQLVSVLQYGREWVLFTAATLGILLIHILLHELGHCWGARRMGEHVDQIMLWPLGGLAYVGHSDDPKKDLFITFAGPAVTILLGILTAGIVLAMGLPWSWDYLNPLSKYWWPAGFTLWQALPIAGLKLAVVLAVFNLFVPAYPLDGGRILLESLKLRLPPARALIVSAFISMPIGILLVILGFMTGWNGIILSLIGAQAIYEAYRNWKMGTLESISDAYGGGYGDRQFSVRDEPESRAERKQREKREREAAERAREDSALRRRVDELLDKVSRDGIGSLTPAERRILEEASARMKDRG